MADDINENIVEKQDKRTSRKKAWNKGGDKYECRLSKRLAYILRYGAEKEGLVVHEGGFVDFLDLQRVHLLRHYTPHEMLEAIENSTSYRNTKRFEKKYADGTVYVRAVHGRNMERNPVHEGSQVPRLLESCLAYISNNITKYDLSTFPDEFLVSDLILRLKRHKKLTRKALDSLLGPSMEHLHLDGAYVTEGMIKLVATRCPQLRVLNLRDCGYVMTDHLMELILRKISTIESLNLTNCIHLTDRTLKALCKNAPNLTLLNLTGIYSVTQAGVLNLVFECQQLKMLDIYSNKNITQEGKDTLVQIARSRGMTVVLKGLTEEGVAPVDPQAAFFQRSY